MFLLFRQMAEQSGRAVSGICTSDPKHIEIRGKDLANEIMGHYGFTDFFFFLVTGKKPSDQQRFFLDLLLVAIAEHGLTPTAQAARMTLAAAPDSLQSAVAAGILGCGTVVLGTAELCAKVLAEAASRVDKGEDPDATVARELEEETGYRANRVVERARFWTTPGFTTEFMYLYEATDLVKTTTNPDEDEVIEVDIVSRGDALRMIDDGRIQDAKSILGLLRVLHA